MGLFGSMMKNFRGGLKTEARSLERLGRKRGEGNLARIGRGPRSKVVPKAPHPLAGRNVSSGWLPGENLDPTMGIPTFRGSSSNTTAAAAASRSLGDRARDFIGNMSLNTNKLGSFGSFLGASGYKSMAARAGLGAAGGYAMTGDWKGAAIGAGGGAGWNQIMKQTSKLGYAKAGNWGVNKAIKGMQMGSTALKSNAGAGFLGGAASYGMIGLGYAGRGARAAGSFLGRNSAATNRYGARAMAGLGIGASAMIGSSVLSSNRGYR